MTFDSKTRSLEELDHLTQSLEAIIDGLNNLPDGPWKKELPLEFQVHLVAASQATFFARQVVIQQKLRVKGTSP